MADQATKRPYCIMVLCEELKGKELQGRFYENGLYVAMGAATDTRDLIEKTLEDISILTQCPVQSLTCEIRKVEEVPLERARAIIDILQGARPAAEIEG